jgi:hypothetical protein
MDTGWFQAAARVASALCFTDGRIEFYRPGGDADQFGGAYRPTGSPTLGSCFFYFGQNAERFAEVFGQFGFVTPKPYAHHVSKRLLEAA